MNRYDPQLLYDLRKSTTQLRDIKPLELTLTQFYAFMLQRYLNKVIPRFPRGNLKLWSLLDMLETEGANPLSIQMHASAIYLPDDNVTWSISKYEGN